MKFGGGTMIDISAFPAPASLLTSAPTATARPVPADAPAPPEPAVSTPAVPEPADALAAAEPAVSTPAVPAELAASARSTASSDPRAKPVQPSAPAHVTVYTDPEAGRLVLQVRSGDRNEVISQFPPDDLLRYYAAAREALEQAADEAPGAGDANDVSA